MKVSEVAKILNVSRQRVLQLIHAKRLSARDRVDVYGQKTYDVRDAIVRNPPLRKYRKAGAKKEPHK